MTTLNQTLNPINAQERVKINQNWDRIMQRFSSLQYQINILSGETSVEDILNALNAAISNANSTVQGLVDTSNQSIANVNQKITEVDGKLVELQTAIDNANLATQATNSAITDARQAIADINAYFANFRFVGEYNATTTYYNFNFVRYQKSTFVSLKENLGITPNDDGINWRLVAAGGIDGMGAVVSVNGKNPDLNGDVTLEPIDIGSASSEQINETNNNLSTLQQRVNEHFDQDNIDAHAATAVCELFRSTNLTTNPGVLTPIIFDTVKIDNREMFNASNPTAVLIKETARYAIKANVAWDTQEGNSQRSLYLRKNGTDFIATDNRHNNGTYCDQSVSCDAFLQEGDYIELITQQTSGVFVDVLSAPSYSPSFTVVKVAKV